MAFVHSPWSLSGLESNATEQDRALTRHIIRVAFQRYRHELRGFVAECVSLVVVPCALFAVPCAQATRPRPNHDERTLGRPAALPDDRPDRGARVPDVSNGSPLSEEGGIEPQHDACGLIVPLGGMFPAIAAHWQHQ